MPPICAPGCSTQYRTLGPMGDVFGEIGVDDDVHAAGAAHLAFHRKADDFGDRGCGRRRRRSGTWRGSRRSRRDPVLHRGRHAIGILRRESRNSVLKRIVVPRWPAASMQDRLEIILRQVAHPRRAGEIIIGLARGMIAPGIKPAEFLAGDAFAEHVVGHQMLWRRLARSPPARRRDRAASPSRAGW